jgi:hypothetical protein
MGLGCWPQYSEYLASHSSSNLQRRRRNSAAKQLHSPPGTLDFENTDDDTVIEEEWKREI